MNSFATYIRMNLRLTRRDRTALFFNYMFPVLLFLILGQIPFMTPLQVVTMALAVGAMGGGLFSIGIRAVSDRERDILRRFKVAPVRPALILVSGIITGLVTYLPLAAGIVVLATVVYDVPWPTHPLSLALVVTIGYLAFSGMGSMVAAVVNSMQESQVVVQMLYFPMLFLGGVTWPVSIMPPWLQATAEFMPSTYLTRALRPILSGEGTAMNHSLEVATLVATAVVTTFLATKLFRWEKEQRVAASAKLWLLLVLAPVLLVGLWTVSTRAAS